MLSWTATLNITLGETPELDSTEGASDIDNSKTGIMDKEEDTSKPTPEKTDHAPTDTIASLQEAYLEKLNAAKKEVEELEPTDSSTFALKN
ncbi:hypothetical protein [Oceanobacillus senegalensis]|uniref:hypothetical protein n=1 Tax=Oceanobacillus senegalensis TaxID=1936063 RepID=UPI001FEC46E3|nr:hypothetical protein [Oceanobacillus senegalensis]